MMELDLFTFPWPTLLLDCFFVPPQVCTKIPFTTTFFLSLSLLLELFGF
jgi:hypothetical protein